MVAVEEYPSTKTEEYLSIFHRYIARSVEAIYTRIGPDLAELSSETREQAWHLLDYALKLAHGWEVVRALLLALAPAMERDGFRHEWLPYLEGGITFSQRAQDVSGEAQLSLYIGRLYRLRGEFAKAHEWFTASAALHEQLGDDAGRAKVLNQLAYVARLQSQFALAKAHVEEALSLLEENDAECATSYWALGTIAHDQMDWTLAAECFQRAYEIAQEANDPQRAAWNLQNLGNALRGAGRYDKAAEYIQQTIVLLGQLHDPVNQAIARMNLGIVHLYRNEAEQSLALFSLAESVFRQVGDQFHLAMVNTNIIIAERELKHWQAAEEAGMKSIRLWEALGDLRMMTNSLDELGVTYLAQGRNDDAKIILERGLEVIAQVPPDPFQEMFRSSLLSHLEEVRKGEDG